MISYSLWMLVLSLLMQRSNAEDKINCTNKCIIVKRCVTNVLTCGESLDTQVIIATAQCIKIRDVFVVGVGTELLVNYLDPDLFKVLINEGMKTLILGTTVTNLTRYTFYNVRSEDNLHLALNGNYLQYLEPMATESRNIGLSFYKQPRLQSFEDLRKVSQIQPEIYCDSKYPPCLCKYLYKINNPFIDTIHIFSNESSETCNMFYPRKCVKKNCPVIDRPKYLRSLTMIQSKKIVPDDYCSGKCMKKIFCTQFFISNVIILFIYR